MLLNDKVLSNLNILTYKFTKTDWVAVSVIRFIELNVNWYMHILIYYTSFLFQVFNLSATREVNY